MEAMTMVRSEAHLKGISNSISRDITKDTDAVFIHCGLNDLKSNKSEIENAVDSLTENIAHNHSEKTFVICSVPPVREVGLQEKCHHINTYISQRCHMYPNTHYMDSELRYTDLNHNGKGLNANGKRKLVSKIKAFTSEYNQQV
jgi:hypothetical protein